jgi:hypothetical protein
LLNFWVSTPVLAEPFGAIGNRTPLVARAGIKFLYLIYIQYVIALLKPCATYPVGNKPSTGVFHVPPYPFQRL